MNPYPDNIFFKAMVSNCFSLLNQDANPGSIMDIMNADQAKAICILRYLIQNTNNLPPGVDLPPGADEVVRKLVTTPLIDLTRFSSLVQPCKPTRDDKARNIRSALSFRQISCECIQGAVTVPVGPECLPPVAVLVLLLELLE